MRVLNFRPNTDCITALMDALKRHPKPYMREKASALLQIARGKSATEVAEQGLLVKRDKQTVCIWVHMGSYLPIRRTKGLIG